MPSRPVPYVGMAVQVVHLAAAEDHVVAEVLDGGRTVVVAGARYTLRRLNGQFVREDEPNYGVRLSFAQPGGAGRSPSSCCQRR